jgi:Fe-S protein assembly co-chaperone HscB
MNYFELYEIPVAPLVNASVIKKKYYELSRKYHPDFFTGADEAEQKNVLEKSSDVNKAFKIFSDEDETLKYFLMLTNVLAEEEKYELPSGFLMEMLELNEELQMAEDTTPIQSQISNLKSQIYEPVKKIMEGYTADNIAEKELLQLKEYYYKKKYLNRILAGTK